MSPNNGTTQFTVEESLAQACHLVARDDTVSAVYLVYPERPTFLEIHSGCELARENQVGFAVGPDGTLVVRQSPQPPADHPKRLVPPIHLPTWSLGFPDLEEGVR